MKARVTLQYTVSLSVEAPNEEALGEWMTTNTPEEVKKLVKTADERWDERYVPIKENSEVDFKIQKEENQ